MKRITQVIIGMSVSLLACVLGVAIWGLLFDSTGGEPFSVTIFGACMLWPMFVLAVVLGTFTYCSGPRGEQAVLVFDGVLVVAAVIVWFITFARI